MLEGGIQSAERKPAPTAANPKDLKSAGGTMSLKIRPLDDINRMQRWKVGII